MSIMSKKNYILYGTLGCHLCDDAEQLLVQAPIVTAENISEPVPATTREVNVEALNSCSAYKINDVCIARTQLSHSTQFFKNHLTLR